MNYASTVTLVSFSYLFKHLFLPCYHCLTCLNPWTFPPHHEHLLKDNLFARHSSVFILLVLFALLETVVPSYVLWGPYTCFSCSNDFFSVFLKYFFFLCTHCKNWSLLVLPLAHCVSLVTVLIATCKLITPI